MSINALRRELGVYVNVRPVRAFRGVPGVAPDLDVVIMRQVKEDTYTACLTQWRNDSSSGSGYPKHQCVHASG